MGRLGEESSILHLSWYLLKIVFVLDLFRRTKVLASLSETYRSSGQRHFQLKIVCF